MIIRSPFQSLLRPQNLPICGPVFLAGSDEASYLFLQATMPRLAPLANVKNIFDFFFHFSFFLPKTQANLGLPEPPEMVDLHGLELDSTNLMLVFPTNVRAYFLTESAFNHNSLAFVAGSTSALFFPDA